MNFTNLTRALIASALIAPSIAAADIRVWHHGGRGDGERETISAQIEAWNAANPSMPASLELLPEGSYNEQVQAAALAGDLPDLLDFDGPNYANYVWSGYLAPLDGLVSADLIANISPSIIAQGTYPADGKLYSLGQFDSGLAIWGRKSLLDAAGVRIPTGADDAWSGAEFEAALDALQALEGIDYALDVKMNYGQGEWYSYGFSPIIQSCRRSSRGSTTAMWCLPRRAMTAFMARKHQRWPLWVIGCGARIARPMAMILCFCQCQTLAVRR